MKFFICGMDGVSLGIPAEQTERVISAPHVQDSVYKSENGEAFISIPLLFRLQDPSAPHGIVLKPMADAEPKKPKTVLLTPSIDIDLEIPEESIHGIPEALSGLRQYFRGACFTDEEMILILNPEKLTEKYND